MRKMMIKLKQLLKIRRLATNKRQLMISEIWRNSLMEIRTKTKTIRRPRLFPNWATSQRRRYQVWYPSRIKADLRSQAKHHQQCSKSQLISPLKLENQIDKYQCLPTASQSTTKASNWFHRACRLVEIASPVIRKSQMGTNLNRRVSQSPHHRTLPLSRVIWITTTRVSRRLWLAWLPQTKKAGQSKAQSITVRLWIRTTSRTSRKTTQGCSVAPPQAKHQVRLEPLRNRTRVKASNCSLL